MAIEGDLPLAALERIMKNAGARAVTKEAAVRLRSVIVEYGTTLSMEAVRLCEHRGAVRVSEDDVELALRALR